MTTIKTLIASVLCVLFGQLSAQDFQGIAIYHTATSIDMKMDSSAVNPDRQKEIMARVAKAMQKEYELRFDKMNSTYTEVETLEGGPGGGRGFRMMGMFGGNSSFYKNTSTKELLEETEFFGKEFLITDTLQDWKWKLGKETKKIGAYTCYKATATRTVKKATLTRGSGDDDKKVEETEETIVAWWTPEIPVSQGPAAYWGLPGLILELNDGTTTMVCSKVVLNPTEKVEIKKFKNGEKVTSSEYAAIIEKKMKEMETMYGGRKGKGKGHGKGSFTIEVR